MSRLGLAALLVVASVVAPAAPAAAAPLGALPPTVRVNISYLGTVRAVISPSSGTMTATSARGVLYKGPGFTLSRRDVRRSATSGNVIEPPQGGWPAGRPGPDVSVVPYEFTALDAVEEGAGPPIYGGAEMLPITFTVDGGFLVLDGQPYRGTLELANDDEGDLIVVNELTTADYLASVVGAEVPRTWEPAALAAQAIAARTYLLTHLGRHRAYDIEGDTRDQAYEGVDTEAPSTIEAVRLTAGVVATYRGAAISALYTANAGGVTENSENVYVNALPYLRSVESPWDSVALTSDWGSPGYRWTREFTPAQLGRYLAVRGLGVGEPQRVELLETTPTGQVMQARVVGTAASRLIGKDGSRYYFGLSSGMFTVSRRAEGDIEDVEPANVRRIKELTELGAQLVDLPIKRVLNADRELIELAIAAFRFRLPEHFQFAGKGYGHRVGMSQWGAQGMALAGHGYEAIIKHYYTGVALTNVGGG